MSAVTENWMNRRVSREVLKERWDMLLKDVERTRGKDGITLDPVNSKRYYRISNALEEMATLLAGGELVGSNEEEALDTLMDGVVWPFLEETLIAWGESLEQGRATYRAKLSEYKGEAPA